MASIFIPIILLFFACLGVGFIVMLPFRRLVTPMVPLCQSGIAYYLGQALVATLMFCLALAGLLSPMAVKAIVYPGAAVGVTGLLLSMRRRQLLPQKSADDEPLSWPWRVLALLAAILYLLGIAGLGGYVDGDALAVYFAVPKLMAYSHTLTPLPGYEFFAGVGLLAETLVAALISLGMPSVSPRIYSWLNYLPMLVLLYGLARQVGLGARGRLLTVIIALTSSAAVILWAGGKTDLYAVGPAVASIYVAVDSWGQKRRWFSWALCGLLCGYASVLKLSYLLPFFPGVVITLVWPDLLGLLASIKNRLWGDARRLLLVLIRAGLLFSLGFIMVFGPHIIKNLYLMGVVLGNNPLASSWYSAGTVRRLLLSYPFALVYGHYWAQHGNISPLLLAFAPLLVCLRRPARWTQSKLAAIGLTTLLGIVLWLILMPSIFMPRYFLATLLLLGLPVAAGAEIFSLRSRIGSLSVLLAAAVVVCITPVHLYRWSKPFEVARTLQYLRHPDREYLTISPSDAYFHAHQSINAVAAKNDRVMMVTYYRFWLRPDLIQYASTGNEFAKVMNDAKHGWQNIKDCGFRFILADTSLIGAWKAVLDNKPDDVQLKVLYNGGALQAYEVIWPEQHRGTKDIGQEGKTDETDAAVVKER